MRLLAGHYIFVLYSPITTDMFPSPANRKLFPETCKRCRRGVPAGIRLARESQVHVRVVPASRAIAESVELTHEIYNRVFRKAPEKMGARL